MRLFVALSLALSLAVMMPGPASADGRIALVAGNGVYKKAAQLPNAPISARAMAALLQGAGFDVVQAIDLTREDMIQRLVEFGRKSRGAELAVFYYSGLAIAVGGAEYLLPVDADIKSASDAELGAAIDIGKTLDETLADVKVRLIFLDANRNNPFADRAASSAPGAPRSGLAGMKSEPDTLIGYATGPGQTAPDGPQGTIRPFTRALIANIAAPGVEIQQAMVRVRFQVNEETKRSQLPWGYSNIVGMLYLRP
jgi:uncharacterized caspase-like protein